MNVCIYRIPRGESIVVNSSHCPVCNTYIKWYDLIPVLSFILLMGRCRHCKTPIGLIYPIVELTNGIVWASVFTFTSPPILSLALSAIYSCIIVFLTIQINKKRR